MSMCARESARVSKKNDAPCDIVAAADGQIQTLEVFGGTAMQERNAAVLKGDTIISGIVETATAA